MNSELSSVIADLERRFDKGIVIQGDSVNLDVESISTGCPSLDLNLGCGGLPRGRVVEVYGMEGGGKSTIALQTIAQAQRQDINCVYLDVENALDGGYAAKLGVDLDKLLISQPSSAEDTMEIAEAFIRSGEIGLIVLDSVASMVTQAEINGEHGDAFVGQLARLMGTSLRKLVSPIAKNNVCFLAINQIRSNISTTGYGGPTNTTPGGRALKFYASQRIEVSRIGSVKVGENVIGNQVKFKIVKNRLSPPFREVVTDLIFGEGFSREADILKCAIDKGIVTQKGAWFATEAGNFGQGKEKARQYLKDNPDFCNELELNLYNPVV
jgi:recombination protein RecA